MLGVDISDSRNFDPARMSDYSSPITNAAVYDRLVTQTPGNYETVEPSLATAWERLEDGKRIRFELRDDVKFFDGSPLTAEDVKFSLDRLLEREGPAGGLRLEPRRHRGRRPAHRRPADQGPQRADHDQPRGAGLRDLLQGDDRGERRRQRPRGRDPGHRRPSGSTRTRPGSGPYHMVAVGAERADRDAEEPALLGRRGAVRARRDPPHRRQRGAAPGARERRHRRRVQPHHRAARDASRATPTSTSTVGPQPRLRLHGADHQPGAQRGAGQAREPARLRPFDRLRRHHRASDGRQRGAPGELPADRRRRLDRAADRGDRLPGGPREGQGAARRRPATPTASSSICPTPTPRSSARATSCSRRRSSPTRRAPASRSTSTRSTRSTCAPSTPAATARR